MSESAPSSTPAPEPEKISGTEAEIHYKELRIFFETLWTRTIWALSVVVGVGGLFVGILFWKSMGEARQSAEKAAISEAEKQVAQTLKDPRISTLVENKAKEALNDAVQGQIAAQLTTVKRQLLAAGKISDMAARVRTGLLSGVNDLNRAEKTETDPLLRDFIAQTKAELTDYFEQAIKGSGTPAVVPKNFLGYANDATPSDRELMGKLYAKMKNETMLTPKIVAVVFLRDMSGQPFSIFDFDAVDKWAKEQKFPEADGVNK